MRANNQLNRWQEKQAKIETPPSTAPTQWADIHAEHWQSNGGRWAAPIHYMCSYMAMFPRSTHYFIEIHTKGRQSIGSIFR